MLKRNGILAKFNDTELQLIELIFVGASPIVDPIEVISIIDQHPIDKSDVFLVQEINHLKKKMLTLSTIVINIIIDDIPFEAVTV